jgi:hypothetical protein
VRRHIDRAVEQQDDHRRERARAQEKAAPPRESIAPIPPAKSLTKPPILFLPY